MARSKAAADKAKAKHLADRPEPDEKIAARLEAVKERVAKRRGDLERQTVPKTKASYLGPNRVMVSAPHTDDTGWAAQMADAFGVSDGRASEFLQGTASAISSVSAVDCQDDAERHRADTEEVLAFVAEGEPRNAVEAALLVQMAAVHRVSCAMASATLRAERRDVQADNARLMNQTMRTFAAQAEALHKLRTGGKQQVEVRYVYVDARTQTVVNGGLGGGGEQPKPGQPHAPGGFIGDAAAPGLPVWGPDPGGDALSVASHPGEAPLPDARGQEPRRS